MEKNNILPYMYKVPIGDYSGDGHGQSKDFVIVTNYQKEKLIESYQNTCTKLGYKLHDEAYFNREDSPTKTAIPLLTDYGDNFIDKEIIDEWKTMGFSTEVKTNEDVYYVDADMCFQLFMWFVSYSMPKDFLYKNLGIESLGFREFIGYGCFLD
ncbi:hypothetical protein [Bacillus sp. NPDC094106]|uniref:hypothetical protein n=1 Tax=Bacillus sp. NPDC094106 TaxID=3363949 RepID=UPI00382EB03E